jgi:hypothetical protein
MRKILAAIVLMPLLGAGCTDSLPFLSGSSAPEYPAEEIDFTSGSTLGLDQTWLGVNVPKKNEYGKKTVMIDDWKVGEEMKLSWSMRDYRETNDSKTARTNAMKNVGVGEEANIPEAVYEDVVLSGTVSTDALDNAERILLPSYWPEGDYDVRRKENSVIWLSKAQYAELAATRTSHLQLGLFDSTLQDILDFTDATKSILGRLQGKIADDTTKKDFTQLTAGGDWGEYALKVNDTEVKVKTIEASNSFGHYTILANPENPLILAVSLRPWALGPSMITSLQALKELVGYKVTEIHFTPSEKTE